MAGADRMTIEEVVRKVLLEEHADVIREAVKAVAAEMMEAEVSELIGAERGERRPRTVRRIATAIGRGAGTPGPARSSCRSPSSARAATSRASWSRAGARSRRCWRWSSRPMSAASRRGASTSWSRASGCGSPGRRSAGSARRWTSTSRRSGRARWRAATPICSWTPRSRRSATAAGCVDKALVIAHGVHETGRREILSIDVGEAETEAFWTDVPQRPGQARPGRRPAGDLRRPRRAEGGDRQGPGLRLAALHRPLPPRLPRPRPQGPARPAGGADPADLQRRQLAAGA